MESKVKDEKDFDHIEAELLKKYTIKSKSHSSPTDAEINPDIDTDSQTKSEEESNSTS